MQQRLRVDGDIFENAPRVDADNFYTDKKRCVFKDIRIRVDEASNRVHVSWSTGPVGSTGSLIVSSFVSK